MEELVDTVLSKDEPSVDGSSACSVYRLVCFSANPGQSGDFSDIAQAGELFQGFLGVGGQSLQLPNHEVHDNVGVALGADASCREAILIRARNGTPIDRSAQFDSKTDNPAAAIPAHQRLWLPDSSAFRRRRMIMKVAILLAGVLCRRPLVGDISC